MAANEARERSGINLTLPARGGPHCMQSSRKKGDLAGCFVIYLRVK